MRPEPQHRIDRHAIRVWRITGLIVSLFLWAIPMVSIVFTLILPLSVWWLLIPFGIVTALTVLLIGIIPPIRWRRWRYEVSEHEIDLQHGVWIVTRTLIPMVRVQHVDTKQGPILRSSDLASVTISTAAGVHEIPALSDDVADALRDRISELARVANEDV